MLYRLAQSTPGVFHDVKLGSNIVPCTSGSPECNNGQLGYYAGAGYDQTTGLGSLNFYNLVQAWSNSAPIATTSSLTASGPNSTVLTATVVAASGTVSPEGTVTFTLGNTALGTASLSGSGGAASAILSITESQLGSGANIITATYQGSVLFNGSSATVSIGTANVLVTGLSVAPSSGSAAGQTFTLQYSDSAGAASLEQVWVYFNSTLANPAVSACMLYYSPATNQISLLNDNVTAWLPATLGAATTLQNSQCSLNVGTATAARNGSILTLKLAMTFQPGFAGAKNIYLHGVDVSGVNGGWQQLGTWTVAASVPSMVSVTPSLGSGTNQTFALQYSDSGGAGSLGQVWVYFNATLANPAVSACMLYYSPATNQINLLNDTVTLWLPATLGTATTLQNSQCSLNVAASSFAQGGNTLTLNLAMSFQAAFAGPKNVYLHAVDISGANGGWQQLGGWTVPGTPSIPATRCLHRTRLC